MFMHLAFGEILSSCIFMCVHVYVYRDRYIQVGVFWLIVHICVKILLAVCDLLAILLFLTSRVMPSYKIILEK